MVLCWRTACWYLVAWYDGDWIIYQRVLRARNVEIVGHVNAVVDENGVDRTRFLRACHRDSWIHVGVGIRVGVLTFLRTVAAYRKQSERVVRLQAEQNRRHLLTKGSEVDGAAVRGVVFR